MSGLVRLNSGGSVVIKTGVVRDLGPQGPVGPVGPQGPPGSQGIQGPQGAVDDARTLLTGTSALSTSSTGWTNVSWNAPAESDNDLLSLDGGLSGMSTTVDSVYQFSGTVTFQVPPGGANGAREVAIFLGGSPDPVERIALAAVPDDDTVIGFSFVVDSTATQTWFLKVRSSDIVSIAATARTGRWARYGIGPAGPTGPTGPAGPVGPAGEQGPAGDAGGGYSSFDSVVTGTTNTEAEPTTSTTVTTTDQEAPYPARSATPAVPYFFKTLAEWIEKRIVARFNDAATLAAKRPTQDPGEVYFLESDFGMYVTDANGDGHTVAQVRVSTSNAPSTGDYPNGTIWITI